MNRRDFILGSTAGSLALQASVTNARAEVRNLVPPNRSPIKIRTDLPLWHAQSRHGRSYSFCPSQTALLVIDMQKHFFVGPNGKYVPQLAPIVPRVVELIDYARKLGCLVIHSREGYAADLSDVSEYRRYLGYVGYPTPLGRYLVRGEPGQDFLDEIRPLAMEPVIDKPGFNSFHESPLDDWLQRAEISHVILCGVTTQCCVHSTLRTAVDLGYWCLTVADCCGAYDKRIHDASLEIIASDNHLFGWVADLAGLKAAKPHDPPDAGVFEPATGPGSGP
jgi:biuret amidohydrolase